MKKTLKQLYIFFKNLRHRQSGHLKLVHKRLQRIMHHPEVKLKVYHRNMNGFA